MKVQLLLLLALVGPFCTFSRASPTEIPKYEKEISTIIPGEEASHEELTVVTQAASDAPEVDPKISDTESPAESTEAPVTQNPIEIFTAVFTIATSEVVPAAVNTERPAPDTDAPAAKTEFPGTEAAAFETAAPIVPAAPDEAQDEGTGTGTVNAESGDGVVVEDGAAEGVSSGQVVGIVIGALVAVVIVIAVVIALVRRMGKYSSAKNKKPAKKRSSRFL